MKKPNYTIEQLEEKIKTETNKYKLQSLKDQLSWKKAEAAGNYVTKADLEELKKLIVWTANRSLFYCTKENLKETMTRLLTKVENKEVIFRTKRGIKGIVTDLTKSIALDVCCSQIYQNNPRLAESSFERMTDPTYKSFEQFRLNVGMGNLK